MKNNNALRIGIIGSGKIGVKRAETILELKKDKVVGVYDVHASSMNSLAQKTGAKTYTSWKKLLEDPEIDCVIVATYHKILPKIVIEALKHGKHVLAEKPLGNHAGEAKQIHDLSLKMKKVVKVGFNHRFHPAVLKAHELFKQGAIGDILYIRSVYGHGGRDGYDLEWRIQKKYTRGGEMYDQGSHIIDMAHWFVGSFKSVFAHTENYFWKKTSLEDNAFCKLVSKKGQTIFFQVSLTQWKNKFMFEVYGSKGYLLVNGLGRSYGLETLTYGHRTVLGSVPKEKVWEFPELDTSWAKEWKNFREGVLNKHAVLSSAEENLEVMKVMDGLYKAASTKKVVKI